jgi:hypothetical protein
VPQAPYSVAWHEVVSVSAGAAGIERLGMVDPRTGRRGARLNAGSIGPGRFDHDALGHRSDARCSDHGFLAQAVREWTFWDPEVMADRTFGAAPGGCGAPVIVRAAAHADASAYAIANANADASLRDG